MKFDDEWQHRGVPLFYMSPLPHYFRAQNLLTCTDLLDEEITFLRNFVSICAF